MVPPIERNHVHRVKSRQLTSYPVVDCHDHNVVPGSESLSAHPDLSAAVEGPSVDEEHDGHAGVLGTVRLDGGADREVEALLGHVQVDVQPVVKNCTYLIRWWLMKMKDDD